MSDEIEVVKLSQEARRQTMQIVDAFIKLGVPFVPIPALNHDDFKQLSIESINRLDLLKKSSEEVKKDG